MAKDQLRLREQATPFDRYITSRSALDEARAKGIVDSRFMMNAPTKKRDLSRYKVEVSSDGLVCDPAAASSVRSNQKFAGVDFNQQSIEEVVAMLGKRPPDASFAYAVTPNADHVVRLHDAADIYNDRFQKAYKSAEWKFCDSRVLSLLAKLRKRELLVVAGSDLTARLFSEVIGAGDTICIVGGNSTIEDKLRMWFSSVNFVFHQPPLGLRDNQAALLEAADFIARAKARFTFIAVGSPQQEILAEIVFSRTNAVGVGLCVGAALEFLTGYSRRAPSWMQQARLEWLHRLLSDPKRLWRRYLIEGPKVFRLALSDKYSAGK